MFIEFAKSDASDCSILIHGKEQPAGRRRVFSRQGCEFIREALEAEVYADLGLVFKKESANLFNVFDIYRVTDQRCLPDW
ncbi:MAG: hypothetical protein ACREV2_08010 [Burkholderiales bacterium]